MTSLRISRRTMLRGMGTAMALPWLEAMLPRSLFAAGQTQAAQAPRRMAFLYVPNGAQMEHLTPAAEGVNYEMTPILQPLARHREDMLVLSGLTCDKGRANGDGPGDHARASGSFLTGVQVRKTAGASFRAGVSADQVAVSRLGDRTRLPSLEIAVERFRGTGNCDSGYSCVYEHTLAWRNSTSPLPTETDPRLVFNRLFSSRPNDPERQRRDMLRSSVLDAVMDDTRSLEARLGGTDRQMLNQYLTNVREMEQRIARLENMPPVEPPEGTQAPTATPAALPEQIKLMCDLLALAFQTDVTRISTFMLAKEGSNIQYRMIGITEGHHDISHHQNNAEKKDKLKKINTYHMEQLAYLADKLKAVREGDGTLLDNCMIAYGSAISDSNRHTHHDLPVVLLGKGGGSVRTGRHVRYPKDTPLNNLWLSMLERFGTRIETIGDSTGLLPGLS
jgi:hypothetical protein